MSNIKLVKQREKHPDFLKLVSKLDQDLSVTDGEDHAFYNQFNGTENIHHIVLAYHENEAVACGAFKVINHTTVEIKRMYTLPNHRGKSIAISILKSLEKWAASEGYKEMILETGTRQLSAITLYKKYGFQIIENYGPYVGVKNSLCFKKEISA